MKLFCWIMFTTFLIHEGIQQEFDPAPANLAVVLRANVKFICGSPTTYTIIWYNSTCYTQPPCPPSDQFYSRNTNPPRYSVTTTTSGATTYSNLLISAAEFTDAGQFICRQAVNATFYRLAVAQLIVIASNPMCQSNTASAVEGTQISITCSVITYGDLYPVMQFLAGNAQVTAGVSGPQTSGQVTSYTLTTTASISPQNITCHTYFLPPIVSDPAAATNAPNYDNIAVCSLPKVSGIQQAFDPAPANLAVVPGTNVDFTCGSPSSLTIFWYNSTCYACPNDQFYDGNTNPARYSVTTTSSGATTYSNLLVSPAAFTDAGQFACRQQFNVTFYRLAVAQLIVIEQAAVCLSNASSAAENDTVVLTCQVMFSGLYAPVMQFLRDDGTNITTGVTNNTVADMSATYYYTFTVNRLQTGKIITCRTYFDQPKSVPTGYSSNMPTYVQTSSCPPLQDVLYPVENISVSPSQTTFDIGDVITCGAGGNPSANYIWMNIGNMTNPWNISQPTLTTTPDMADTIQIFQCIAYNNVSGQIYRISKTIYFYVTTVTATTTPATTTPSFKTSNTTAIIIGVVVGVVGALLVILLVVVVLCCLRRKIPRKEHPMPIYQNSNMSTSTTSDVLENIPYESVTLATDATPENSDHYQSLEPTTTSQQPSQVYQSLQHVGNENTPAATYYNVTNIATN